MNVAVINDVGDGNDFIPLLSPSQLIKGKGFELVDETEKGEENTNYVDKKKERLKASYESNNGLDSTKFCKERLKASYESNNGLDSTKFCPASYRNDDFFAESPYFDAFINKEMHALSVVAETINDIAAKTKDFSQSGLKMAVATRRLASSCKIDSGYTDDVEAQHNAFDPEIVDGLKRLGDVLDEMASAQEHLCQFLNSSIVSQLKSIATKEKNLRPVIDESQNETDGAEHLFQTYFHGGKKDDSWGNLEGDSDRGDVGSGDFSPRVAKHLRRLTLSPRRRRRCFKLLSPDAVQSENYYPSVANSTRVTRWKHELLKVRTLHISAELKRHQLVTSIADLKNQQNGDMSDCAIQMVSEMGAYYSHCSNLVTGLKYCTTSMKKKCEMNNEIRDSEERHKLLNNALILARQAEIDAQLHLTKDSKTIGPMFDASSYDSNYDLMEEYAQLWDLPATLASYSCHSRRIEKNVLAEGWLYGKNTSWDRNWFVIQRDGVFTLSAGTAGQIDSKNKNGHNNFVERIKVCNLQFCTVREIKDTNDDPSTRFCFELSAPTSHMGRLVLQARGPHELQMWLDASRCVGIYSETERGEGYEVID